MCKTCRFQNSTGYSSHHHNPFLAVTTAGASETTGDVYGFSLIYTGSHAGHVEQGSTGTTRVQLGMNPDHLSWPVTPGEDFTTPECVTVFSQHGLGGMSRSFHGLYRNHLSKSAWTLRERPSLINNWEATFFDMDHDICATIARKASDLGVRMFVMDDGWFGNKHPRVNDHAGLGDWVVNPRRFPDGLGKFVEKITDYTVKGEHENSKMKFGLWLEPEMVNPQSELFEQHPDWVLSAPGYPQTQVRNQLVLDLSQTQVQDYLIDSVTEILSNAAISYIKWDNNRGIHELATPATAHAYMLGLYRVLETLTSRFPDVLWEGCASGGGRFDPGLLHYWPQHWTSDNTDALDRLFIQFGTSLVYPPSAFGCHVSATPNDQTGRTEPLEFRAHVAMMGGSYGYELDLNHLSPEEQAMIPRLTAQSERVNPFVIHGDLFRINRPDESNWPTALYLSQDRASGVLLTYRMKNIRVWQSPAVKLQGLDPEAVYELQEDGKEKVRYHGDTLMNVGLKLGLVGDYQSRVIFLYKR